MATKPPKTDPGVGTLAPVTTPLGGGTADLVAELRAQAEAAVTRAAETKDQVAREVVEVRAQADAVAAALEGGARQAAEAVTAEAARTDVTVLAEARAQAASAIAEAEAKAASIRVSAAEAADDATAALARAEVRHDSAAVQADALRLTTRRGATMDRRHRLDETHQVAHGQLNAASDVVSRLGVTLEDLSKALTEIGPATARLHADLDASSRAAETDADSSSARESADDSDSESDVPPTLLNRHQTAADRLRRVRHR